MSHETFDHSAPDGAAESDEPRPRITVLSDSPEGPASVQRLHAHGEIRLAHDEASLREALPGSDILLVTDFRTEALEAAWPAADSLRWVHAASAGVDQLMFDALIESDIPVTNAQGIFDRSIAEYVLGAILMFAKDTRSNIRYQQERRWVHRDTESIHGERVLVAGAGSIGREIGRLCKAVGMDVTGIARRARAADDVFSAIHAADDIDAHLPDADYVVVAAPLTEATEGWFDKQRFAAMAPHGRPHRICRRDAPCRHAAKTPLLRGIQRFAHRGIGEDMHQPLAEKAETLGMAIHRHDHFLGGDTRPWCRHQPAVALPVIAGCRAVLVQADGMRLLRRQAKRQLADIERRLQHHRAGKEQAGAVELASCQLLHLVGI